MSPKKRKRERREQRRADERARSHAEQTQRAQREAEARRARYLRRRRRRTLAIALFTLAGVMAVSHILEHAGLIQLMRPGLQDLLIGWPMAAFLAIMGGVAWGT